MLERSTTRFAYRISNPDASRAKNSTTLSIASWQPFSPVMRPIPYSQFPTPTAWI
ncbi:MAG: hypothetical protein F6J98_03025 [Moorea sp. SIO4G2]|uniref:hypothetical protein n=1 Tax=unclassified Moorena TaxID=2683338 RepID=UPI0013F7A9EC|nr:MULTISPECIES: hypothetical protein [unclassified Moorena]NEO17275.1 hypothetical protein [Moorena sp. SIO3E8]NEO59425.1 hypothetical protein [Moorena sp. SIO4G2]NEQ03817.1 hypothetical protein [Moorena sp. SIO3F7]